ncbi:MAG: Hpt domain-containing protein [Pseudomonadota bacterium]
MNSNPVDFQQGLRHCNDEPAIYYAVLQQFQAQYQTLLVIDSALADDDHALLQLHTLKGLSSTIGASHLSNFALASYQQWSQLGLADKRLRLQQLNECLTVVLQAIARHLDTR